MTLFMTAKIPQRDVDNIFEKGLREIQIHYIKIIGKYKYVFQINEFKYFWPLNISMTVENFIYEIKNSNEMKYQYLPIWMVDSRSISHVINGKNTGINVI